MILNGVKQLRSMLNGSISLQQKLTLFEGME